MSVIYIVLPLALIMAALGLWAFIWAVRGGQMDDLETPAIRMLHDDTAAEAPSIKPVASGGAGPGTPPVSNPSAPSTTP